jgi:RNA polymerase sigma factor (sigma-70 family)
MIELELSNRNKVSRDVSRTFNNESTPRGHNDQNSQAGTKIMNKGANSEPLTALGCYFADVNNHKLLTPEQEKVLAEIITEGYISDRDFEGYFRMNDSVPEEEAEFLKGIKDREDAKQKFIISNLRLVIPIAKNYINRGVDFMDLIQEGNIGMMTAVDKFESGKGGKFSNYSYWYIKGSVIRALANQGNLNHLQGDSDQRRSREDNTNNRYDMVASGEDGPEEKMIFKSQSVFVEKMLNTLDPRMREILILRFFEEKKLDEVGERFGISDERVRQLQDQALGILKKRFSRVGVI